MCLQHQIKMDDMYKSKKRIFFLVLLVALTMMLAPFAVAELSDYVEPLAGLDIPLDDVMGVHQNYLYNKKYEQLAAIYRNGYRISDRSQPQIGSPDFRRDIFQKRADYNTAIKIFENIVQNTRNELHDDRMRTLHDNALEAIASLRVELQELEDFLEDDDSECIGENLHERPSCEPDGRHRCWYKAWLAECDRYDDGDYIADLEREEADKMLAEARGEEGWWSWHYLWIIIPLLLFILWALHRGGLIRPVAGAAGWIGQILFRGVGVLIIASLFSIAWLTQKLIRFINRRMVIPRHLPPAGGAGGAPGGAGRSGGAGGAAAGGAGGVGGGNP